MIVPPATAPLRAAEPASKTDSAASTARHRTMLLPPPPPPPAAIGALSSSPSMETETETETARCGSFRRSGEEASERRSLFYIICVRRSKILRSILLM